MVQPFPAEQVEEIFRQDQQKPLAEVFVGFDPVPIASASIAQVHRARLMTGESVVIKVQRPEIQLSRWTWRYCLLSRPPGGTDRLGNTTTVATLRIRWHCGLS